MSDHHDHDHPDARLPDAADKLTYYQTMEVAVRELLIDKGILTADEVRRQIEDMDATPGSAPGWLRAPGSIRSTGSGC